MTRYCPVCENEFLDSVDSCPDDNAQLFDSPVSDIKRKELVDFYVVSGEIEAEFIAGILSENGLTARIFRPQISQFPTLTDRHFVIAIKPDEKDKGTELLRRARNDSVISDSGAFL